MTEPQIQAENQVVDAPKPAAPKHEHGHVGVPGGLQWLLSVIVIATFVMTFIVQAFEIPSESMEDTLLIGDYLLVDKVTFANSGLWHFLLPYHDIEHGNIIVFRYPVHPAQHFVKRVIGVPGDRVKIVNKQVFVNGKPLSESYTVHKRGDHDFFRDEFPTSKYISGNVESRWWLQMRKLTENGELIVPEGHYFVLGDNRDDSLDSRYWGFVPAENVVGRPLVIYWSVNREGDEEGDNTSVDAKLKRVISGLRHVFRDTRWKRTMTVVR